MNPVIVCIAKFEHDYIEEFVKYHLALGFKCIYLYDNEDVPTYEKLLSKYKENLHVIHMPFNIYSKGVKYIALENFVSNYLFKSDITHVAHIDIDEFIVLKKHTNITAFIEQYITGDCQAIGMNWRFFGSSGRTEKSEEPVTLRFTMCQRISNMHIKTLFKKDFFKAYNTCHDICLSRGVVKSTNGTVIVGPFNNNNDCSVIQLNHYKSKTLPEYRYIRQRGRADLKGPYHEDIDESFKHYDINEVEDMTAHDFYKSLK